MSISSVVIGAAGLPGLPVGQELLASNRTFDLFTYLLVLTFRVNHDTNTVLINDTYYF